MRFIASSIVGLSLLALASGCSDAERVAEAFEKVCKVNCECPSELDDWNKVSNCKAACEGESKIIKYGYADRETEPCKDIANIVSRIEDCANQDCTDIWSCVNNESNDLASCWPQDFAVGDGIDYQEQLEVRAAMREQITAPFPEPLLDAAFGPAPAP